MFSHLSNNTDISPLKELSHLYNKDAPTRYKKMTAYEKLMEELRATNMTSEVKQ
jgi:hypothetical protein